MVAWLQTAQRGGIMLEAHQSRPDLSHVEVLLDQQEYQEALAPLAQLIEENPRDRQIRLYRLLAVRLLILSQMVREGSSPSTNPARPRTSEPRSKIAAALRNLLNLCSTRWLQSIARRIEAPSATKLIKRIGLALAFAGLFVTPVSFCLGVAEQQIDGANKHSFYVGDSFAGKVEQTHEQSLGALANQVRSVQDLRGEDRKLRIVGLPPHAAGASRRKPALTDSTPGSEIKVVPRQPTQRASDLKTVYKTKRSLSLRKEPRFAAASLQQVAEGTHMSVLGVSGNWLKVKSEYSGAVGYLRKEFLITANRAP
jgi:hypothetical protein